MQFMHHCNASSHSKWDPIRKTNKFEKTANSFEMMFVFWRIAIVNNLHQCWMSFCHRQEIIVIICFNFEKLSHSFLAIRINCITLIVSSRGPSWLQVFRRGIRLMTSWIRKMNFQLSNEVHYKSIMLFLLEWYRLFFLIIFLLSRWYIRFYATLKNHQNLYFFFFFFLKIFKLT